MAQGEARQAGARSHTLIDEVAWGLQCCHFNKPKEVSTTVYLLRFSWKRGLINIPNALPFVIVQNLKYKQIN